MSQITATAQHPDNDNNQNQESQALSYYEEVDKESINMYDFEDNDDGLYATKEDAEELIKQGDIAQEFLLKQGGGEGRKFDNSRSYHRITRIDKKEDIVWTYPVSKKDKEQNLTGEEIRPDTYDEHKFVAVRGIVLGFYWGSSVEGTHNSNFKTVCQTSGLIEHLPTGNRKTIGDYPIKIPFKQMHKDKDHTNEPSYFFTNNPHLDPIATRYDANLFEKAKETGDWSIYYKSGQERRCLECISKGENKFVMDDGEKLCAPQGYMLMVVYQLGRQDKTRHKEEEFENPIDINWVDVADAGITDYKGDPLDRPFVLRIDRIKKSMLSNVGSGKFDIPVKLPKDFAGGRQRKNYYLPNDSVMSCGQLHQWLHAKGTGEERTKMHKKGFPVYPVIVEMYTGKLQQTTYSKDYHPVFNIAPLDKSNCFNAIHIDQYVSTALTIARLEAAAAEGKEAEFGRFGLQSSEAKAKLEASKETKSPSKPSRSFSSLTDMAYSVKPVTEDSDDEDDQKVA